MTRVRRVSWPSECNMPCKCPPDGELVIFSAVSMIRWRDFLFSEVQPEYHTAIQQVMTDSMTDLSKFTSSCCGSRAFFNSLWSPFFSISDVLAVHVALWPIWTPRYLKPCTISTLTPLMLMGQWWEWNPRSSLLFWLHWGLGCCLGSNVNGVIRKFDYGVRLIRGSALQSCV